MLLWHTGISSGGGASLQVYDYNKFLQGKGMIQLYGGVQDPQKYWYTEASLNLFKHFGSYFAHPLSFELKGGFIKRFQIASLYFATGIDLLCIKLLPYHGYELKKAHTMDTVPGAPYQSVGYQIFPAPFFNIGYIAHFNKTWGLKFDFYILGSFKRKPEDNIVFRNGEIYMINGILQEVTSKFHYYQMRVMLGAYYNKKVKNA